MLIASCTAQVRVHRIETCTKLKHHQPSRLLFLRTARKKCENTMTQDDRRTGGTHTRVDGLQAAPLRLQLRAAEDVWLQKHPPEQRSNSQRCEIRAEARLPLAFALREFGGRAEHCSCLRSSTAFRCCTRSVVRLVLSHWTLQCFSTSPPGFVLWLRTARSTPALHHRTWNTPIVHM